MGEHITQKLPQSIPYPDGQVRQDDMIWVWNSEEGQLQRAYVSQLPFGTGGGGGVVTHLGSPFIVTVGDDQVNIIDGDTIISDVRLLGKTDYPVYTTQTNTQFRRDELIYDGEAGTLTIPGFELQAGEEICLIPQGQQSSGGGGSLQPLWDEINTMKAMLAPFLPTVSGANHARVWWTGGLPLPEGWQEDTVWRDYTPIHSPTGAPGVGTNVGVNSLKLVSNQLGSFDVRGRSDRSAGAARGGTWPEIQFRGQTSTATLLTNNGSNQWTSWQEVKLKDASANVDVRQKSKYGMWIKYVGA